MGEKCQNSIMHIGTQALLWDRLRRNLHSIIIFSSRFYKSKLEALTNKSSISMKNLDKWKTQACNKPSIRLVPHHSFVKVQNSVGNHYAPLPSFLRMIRMRECAFLYQPAPVASFVRSIPSLRPRSLWLDPCGGC